MKFTDVVAAAIEQEKGDGESVELQTQPGQPNNGCQAQSDSVEFPLTSGSGSEQPCPSGSVAGTSKANIQYGNSKYRFKNIARAVQNNTMEFLGLTEDWEQKHDARWRQQRLRLATRQGQDKACKSALVQQALRRKAAQARANVAARDATDARELASMMEEDYVAQGSVQERAAADSSADEMDKDGVVTITLYALSQVAGKWKKAAAMKPPPEDACDAPDSPQRVEQVAFPPPQASAGRVAGVRDWLCSKRQQVKDNHDDSRPYFTYWVSTVQVIVLVLSMVLYTTAPYGAGLKTIQGEILTTSLSLEVIVYEEPGNLWLGPRQADLVALGAKYTPCMRPDAKIQSGVAKQRAVEATTGCCIRHDLGGCVQTVDDLCSENLSHWDKWTEVDPGPDERLSGPVCGQDPRVCTAPASVAPNVWPDDITLWPVCLASNVSLTGAGPAVLFGGDTSITCEVVGRPCCVGIHGECHITTREHCTFLHGTFHEEAALCSQVQCLSDVCKMLAFLDPDVPDQVYRLWVSIFIHPGLVPLLFTLFLHMTLLRPLEKFAGTVRVTIIYILSGIAGNLGSAIFVPYRPEVGPSGSIAGTIGCLFVIFIVDMQEKMRSNWRILLKWFGFLAVCFIAGLFPGVDNYANIFGFIMGVLLAAALLPHVGRGAPSQMDDLVDPQSRELGNAGAVGKVRDGRWRRALVVVVSLCLAVALLVALFVVFYLVPFECDWCGYLDCIPLTDTLCADMQTSFERHHIIT